MKKYYSLGEIILALREEYFECKHLLDEMNSLIDVKGEYINHNITGLLPYPDKKGINIDQRIRLRVEKKYNAIKKEIQQFRYGSWSSQFFYNAYFNAEKQKNGLYQLIFDEENGLSYVPKVEITDPKKFSELADELLTTDLMQLKNRNFGINRDRFSALKIDSASIYSNVSNGSLVVWNGADDTFRYSLGKGGYALYDVGGILRLEVPTDRIPPEWLELLEKHKDVTAERHSFHVLDLKSKKGKFVLTEETDFNDSKTYTFQRKK